MDNSHLETSYVASSFCNEDDMMGEDVPMNTTNMSFATARA